MLLKHMLGFFTLYLFISLVDTRANIPRDLVNKLLLAIFIYIWFIFTTRMNINYWIPMIFCIGMIYILQLNVDSENKLDNPNKTKIKNVEHVQTGLVILAGVLTIVGFGSYFNQKRIEYGSDFRVSTFLVGNISCKGT